MIRVKPSIGKIDFGSDKGKEPITLIVDSSGMTTVSKKGHYIEEEKWIRKKKEFVKLHISLLMQNPRKWFLSFRITRGNIYMTPKSFLLW